MTIRTTKLAAWSVLLLAAAITVGCGRAAPDRPQLGVGDTAPAIEAEGWIDGVAPASTAGKVVVLEAWAHW